MVEALANSPMATGSGVAGEKILPPRPPAPTAGRSPVARSACKPHREWIEAQIRLGRNAKAIYQDLVDQHGFASRYNSVKRLLLASRSGRLASGDSQAANSLASRRELPWLRRPESGWRGRTRRSRRFVRLVE